MRCIELDAEKENLQSDAWQRVPCPAKGTFSTQQAVNSTQLFQENVAISKKRLLQPPTSFAVLNLPPCV